MQNLMIIDNNILYIQKIINSIPNSIENIKLYNFFLKPDENILKKIDDKEIDVIIVNIEIYGSTLIEYITKNKMNIYKKSIIVLYKDIKQLKKSLKGEYKFYIFKCIQISENIECLLENLRILVYAKENKYDDAIIKCKIERNLIRLGFRLNNIGTKYIIESVEYLYKNNMDIFKLNDLYSMLAKKHNKTLNTIKGDITSANKSMKKKCDKSVIMDFFNYFELIDMPTITEIITALYEKI